MGKTEKLSLLGVALVVIVLFVWSLGSDEPSHARESGTESRTTEQAETPAFVTPEPTKAPGAGAAGNDGTAAEVSEGLASPEGRTIELEAPGGRAGSGLLFADVKTDVPAAPRGGIRRLPDWDLVDIAGLETTLDPHMLTFRPRPGDTWESLALRFYGSGSRAELLRHNNEGMDAPGELISVPAKDDLGEAAGVLTVQVQRGETLWEVARRTLGDGARWKEIYDANRDVISDPNYLVPGTMLTIR